jgi:hypothetical protein
MENIHAQKTVSVLNTYRRFSSHYSLDNMAQQHTVLGIVSHLVQGVGARAA